MSLWDSDGFNLTCGVVQAALHRLPLTVIQNLSEKKVHITEPKNSWKLTMLNELEDKESQPDKSDVSE